MPTFLLNIVQQGTSPFAVFSTILRNGGLIVFYPIFVWMCWEMWKYWIGNLYGAKKKFVLLAIDIPKLNEQSMKAVEQMIINLHGVHFGPNVKQKYWQGVSQDKFSLEIVSIDGYIQFLISCDDYNADLAKGAVYAQYPDAEIVEVEDYVPNVPDRFPDKEWEMWGTELRLVKPDVYPIKTYDQFEHPLTGIFADPMASVLEILSRLRPGEQVWIQVVITPEGFEWRKKGEAEVNALIARSTPSKSGFSDFLVSIPVKILEMVHDALFTVPDAGSGTYEQDGSMGNFQNLPTGEKNVVEEVEKKIARIPWKTKIRIVYIGKKTVFHPYRVIGGIFGIVKQYNTMDLNALRVSTLTVVSKPVYYLVKYRQNVRKRKIMLAYKARSNWAGEEKFVLSSAEVATIFHFPAEQVLAPMTAKAEAKKAEPPSRLPTIAEEQPAEGTTRRWAVSVKEPGEPPSVVAPGTGAEAMVDENATPSLLPSSSSIPVRAFPLHSMPGLPPGIHPTKAIGPRPGRAFPEPSSSRSSTPSEEAPVTSTENSAPPTNLPFHE